MPLSSVLSPLVPRGERKEVRAVASLLLSFALATVTLAADKTGKDAPTFAAADATSVTNKTDSAPASPATEDKHKLQAGDKISFRIEEDREPTKLLTVTDSGELDVPYLGLVSARDKSCGQLSAELKKLLEKEFYYRATVVIGLDSASKTLGRVYIWGQVKNQGPIEIPINETFTAGKAILRAGGFGEFANKKKVKVIRGSGVDGSPKKTFELNMVEILEDGKTEKDIPLEPDDFIIVPQKLINL